MSRNVECCLACLLVIQVVCGATLLSSSEAEEPAVVLELPPSDRNPRNSEGDFIRLEDGRILYIYTHFTAGAGDHAAAHLAARQSSDGGKTWTDRDEVVIPNEGKWNIMSVSLLRLASGKIALFYARKNSLDDCRPVMRVSTDEARTWSDPVECITDQIGYYVLNNDRVVQLRQVGPYQGRLILPVSLHNLPGWEKPDWKGEVMCYFSDDEGRTWRRSRSRLKARTGDARQWITQEPGIVELRDGRLMLFCRSNAGSQLVAWSDDGGDTWSELKPSSLKSPVSPATIERIPGTDVLVAVWNDHRQIAPAYRGKRTPLSIAVSRDEGKTWSRSKTLFDSVHGWYCYTALLVVDDHLLLGHCAGDRRKNNGLAKSQITRVPVRWLPTLENGP